MKARTLTILIAVVALAVVIFLLASRQSAQPTAENADVTMTLDIPPEMLSVGEAQLTITLRRSDGTPIDDARLQVIGNMDHAGMIPVEREVQGGSDGRYEVPFEWTMGGGWIVTVNAALPNNEGQISQDFEFFVDAVSRQSVINQTPQDTITPTPNTP